MLLKIGLVFGAGLTSVGLGLLTQRPTGELLVIAGIATGLGPFLLSLFAIAKGDSPKIDQSALEEKDE